MPDEHTIAGLPSFVDSLRRRLKEKTGDAYVFAQIAVTVDGWRVYFSPNGPAVTFEAPFLDDAIAQAEAWLGRDELSEVNLTLGLTATGALQALREMVAATAALSSAANIPEHSAAIRQMDKAAEAARSILSDASILDEAQARR